MAYGTKYYLKYTNWLGFLTEIYVKKKDYTGAVSNVQAGPDPLVVEYMGRGDDRIATFKGSVANFYMKADRWLDYKEFFDTTDRDYIIEKYVAGSLNWKGYVIPGIYKEPRKYMNYIVQLQATDGLGDLKSYKFLTSGGIEYSGAKTLMEILVICLDKIGLDLDIWSHVNIYEKNMSSTASDDPLIQAKINCNAFYEGSERKPMKCYDVIEKILKPFGARILQYAGAWHIIPFAELSHSHTYRLFDHKGIYISNGSFDPVKNTTGLNIARSAINRIIGEETTQEMVSAYREVQSTQNYQPKDNIIIYGKFPIKIFTGSLNNADFLYGWTKADTGLTLEYHQLTDGSTVLSFKDNFNITDNYIYNEKFTIEADSKQDLVVKLRMRAIGGSSVDSHEARVRLIIGNINQFDESKLIANNTDWQEWTIRVHGIDITGDAWLMLYGDQNEQTDGYLEYNYVIMTIESHDYDTPPDDQNDDIINTDYAYTPEEYEFNLGDGPDIPNAQLIYDNVLFLASGHTSAWHWKGYTDESPLVRLTMKEIIRNYGQNTLLLSASLLSHIGPLHTICDINNNNKLYMLNGAEWHDRGGHITGEWIEIKTYEENNLLQENGDYLLQESLEKIIL